MQLLQTPQEWNNLKSTLLRRFNIPHGYISGEPKEYPCMMDYSPGIDLNGYCVHITCFYKKDALELLNYE